MPRPLVILLVALVTPVAIVAQADSAPAPDPIPQLVARLDLERYKATIKGLTAFGDRRQGTDRNRAAVDWIEAQLRGYGCSDVARLKYDYQPPSSPSPDGRGGQGGEARRERGSGGEDTRHHACLGRRSLPRHADRGRVGPELAPAHRSLCDL